MKKITALFDLVRSKSFILITDEKSQARVRFNREANPLITSIQISSLRMMGTAIKQAINELEENYGRYERGSEKSPRNTQKTTRGKLLRNNRTQRGKDSPQNKPRNRKSS